MNDDAGGLDGYGRPVGLMAAGPVGGASGPVIPPPPAARRHPDWPKVLRAFLKANPTCAGCGRRAETGHHVVPVGVDAGKELDPANLAAVCVPCHFVVCHGGNWNSFVPDPATALAVHAAFARGCRPVNPGGAA